MVLFLLHTAMSRGKAFISPWYKANSIPDLLANLYVGDRLEFDRVTYKHWAICVTIGFDAHVVHRTGDSLNYISASISSSGCDNAVGKICLEALFTVLGDDRVRINNSLDSKRTPKSDKMILTSAVSAIDNDDDRGQYHLLFNNCEHFVNWCRYGAAESQQVIDTVIAVAVGVIGVALGVARLLR